MEKGNKEEKQLSTLTTELLSIINGLNGIDDKLYCWPSQKKLVELLDKRFSVKRTRRTINRQLKEMEKLGFIERTRRHRRDKLRGMIFKSTLYKITLRGYDHLRKIGVNVWKQINILRKIMEKKLNFESPGDGKASRKGDLTALKDIFGGLKIPRPA